MHFFGSDIKREMISQFDSTLQAYENKFPQIIVWFIEVFLYSLGNMQFLI